MTLEKSEFDRLRPGLIQFFRMKGCGEDPSEELAQETLYRVWREYSNSEDPSLLGKPFAVAVAKHVIHEWWRARKRVLQLHPDLPEPADPRAGILPQLMEGPELEEKLKRFRRCCDHLKPLHRRLFDQYHRTPTAEGRQALAAELGINENALRGRICFITRKIRRCMKVPLASLGGTL